MKSNAKETRPFQMTLNNDLRYRAIKIAKRKAANLSLSTLIQLALTKYCDEAERETAHS